MGGFFLLRALPQTGKKKKKDPQLGRGTATFLHPGMWARKPFTTKVKRKTFSRGTLRLHREVDFLWKVKKYFSQKEKMINFAISKYVVQAIYIIGECICALAVEHVIVSMGI